MPNSGTTSTNIFGQTTTSPPNPEQQLLGQLGASVAPQTGQAQLQYNLGQEQLGLVGPEYQNQLAYNNAMAGYQQGSLGLSAQQIGIQQVGQQQQAAQSQAQQGFEQQQYALQQQQYPEQSAEAALAYQNALRNTQGSQAISGTQNTVGGRADVNTLGQNYGFQQQDIARSQALSQLGQKSELSGYQYSQEQLQNAQKSLALSSQANGLSQQQMLTMLNYGNQQAGVGAQQDIISLLAQQGGNAIGQVSNAGSALSQIGFASGLNALAGTG